jgi:DNA-directed RNA polymerase alpha subunit
MQLKLVNEQELESVIKQVVYLDEKVKLLHVNLRKLQARMEKCFKENCPSEELSLLDSPNQLGLGIRLENIMCDNRIETIQELCNKSPGTLLKYHHFGKVYLNKLRDALNEHRFQHLLG